MPSRSAIFGLVLLPCFAPLLGQPAAAQARCADPAEAALPAGPRRDGIRTAMALTPVIWSVVGDRIYPVRGSDGRLHLAFSAVLTNITDRPAAVTAIAAVDPARNGEVVGTDAVVATAGAAVTGKLVVFGAPRGPDGVDFKCELPPGGSGAVFLDLTLPGDAAAPVHVALRVTVAQTDPSGAGREVMAVALPTPVAEPPVVLSPPLRGAGWFDGDGCCRILDGHRLALNPINGALRPAEQFAIDFVRLGPDGRLFSGEVTDLKSWPYYGVDVLAAASGTVVEVVRDRPDEVPGKSPPTVTAEGAAGNHVIVDMGQSRYALYAHLAPESATVKVGDAVRQGQRLGALGNSGNTDAPHLHFHVMDRPSPLDAVGLPFAFDRMRLRGRVTMTADAMADLLMTGQPLPIATEGAAALSGAMPLTMDLMDFE